MGSTARPLDPGITMATTRKTSAKIAKLQGYVVRGVTGSLKSTLSNDVNTKRSQIRLVRPTVASKVMSRTQQQLSATSNATLTTVDASSVTNWTSALTDLFNSTAMPTNESATDQFLTGTSNWFTTDPSSGGNFTWDCPLLNDSDYSNVTCGNGTHNQIGPKDYWALLLFLFPILTVFGNVLVILSVYRERTLQTATNYFIISLAIADLLVATLVMPFAVYAMVNGEWGLPAVVCDFYIAMDVTSSTSSIFNLVAISIDRYIAVTQPIKYARHKNHKRVWLTIGLVWLISAAIGSPIVLGLNHTPIRDPTMCMFYNYDFVIYSSLSSFYIPCIIMVVLYYQIFKAIRERAKKAANSRKQPHNSHLMNSMAPHTKHLAETALGGPVLPTVSAQQQTTGSQQQQRTPVNNSTPAMAPATISGSTPGDLGALPASAALNTTKHTLLGRAASTIKASRNKRSNSTTNKRNLFEDDKTTEGSGSQDDDDDDDRDDDEGSFEADNGTGYHQQHRHNQQVLPRDGSSDFILAATKQNDPTVAAVAVSSAVLAPTVGCGRKSSGNGSKSLTNGANQQQQGPPSPPQASSDSFGSGGGHRESQRNKATKRGNGGRCGSGGGDSVDKESKQHQSAGSRFTIYKVNKASRKKREKSSAKKERKATKTLAIVLGVFLICWVPFFTCNIMDAICSKLNRDCQPGVTAFLLTTWLGYVNSFINPVIYTIFNLEFRKAFKRILTCAD